MERRIQQLAVYLRGWMGYFRFCETPSIFKDMDSWIRRRLRCVQWKQWKTCKRRYQALRKRGLGAEDARKLGYCSRGPWPLSAYALINIALPNAYFDSLGLPRLVALYRG